MKSGRLWKLNESWVAHVSSLGQAAAAAAAWYRPAEASCDRPQLLPTMWGLLCLARLSHRLCSGVIQRGGPFFFFCFMVCFIGCWIFRKVWKGLSSNLRRPDKSKAEQGARVSKCFWPVWQKPQTEGMAKTEQCANGTLVEWHVSQWERVLTWQRCWNDTSMLVFSGARSCAHDCHMPLHVWSWLNLHAFRFLSSFRWVALPGPRYYSFASGVFWAQIFNDGNILFEVTWHSDIDSKEF